ncbi:MAG TPA: phytoene/squalene synthase family protein [Ignavibacteria bacterium]|nr:phytoene/squalene synthase family protein [Ignavibacteria bacterium]
MTYNLSNKKVDTNKLNLAYSHCKFITKTYAKTFYFTSNFLPENKKNAAYAVYSFCRYIDDIVDLKSINQEKNPEETIFIAIEKWRSDLKTIYNGNFIDHPIMISLKDTLSKFNIPQNLPNELIDGVVMDMTIKRYDNFENLRTYCYKVASVVGLMTMEIFGYNDKSAIEYAIDMGIAMQLTNILRDIKEDAEKNRIYIPKDEFEKFDYSENEFLNFIYNKNFINLMRYQIERANYYYDRAEKGIKYLDRDSRMTVGLMCKNYRKILNEIESMDFNVYNSRAYVPFYKKILNVPRVYLEFN